MEHSQQIFERYNRPKTDLKSHMTYVISKTTVAAKTCSRIFGKSRGLKPIMTYQSIVTPMIMCTSLVCWPRTEHPCVTQIAETTMAGLSVNYKGNVICPTAALEDEGSSNPSSSAFNIRLAAFTTSTTRKIPGFE